MSDLASKIISLSPATTAGSGELNLVGSPSNASGWLSANGGGTLATTSTAGDLPLGPAVTTAIKITSGTSLRSEATLVETNSFAFTTPAAYAVKTKVELWMRPGTLFLPNEWTVSVYAGSTRQALTTDSSSVTYLPNANGKFTTYFDAVASTAYTVRLTRTVNAGTNASVLNVANVIVGPGIQPQGAMVGPTLAYTPTITGLGTVSSMTVDYQCVGDVVNVVGALTAGTVTAAAVTTTLPNSYTSSSILSAQSVVVGSWIAAISTGATRKRGNMLAVAGSSTVYFASDDNTTAASPFSLLLGTNMVNNGIAISFQFSVPVNELAGSGTVNLAQNDVEYAFNTSTSVSASDSTSFGYGPGGALIQSITTALNRTVSFPSPFQVGDVMAVEVAGSQAGPWVPVVNSVSPTGTGSVIPYQFQNGVTYGIGILQPGAAGTSTVTLAFGTYAIANGATYGAAGQAWSVGVGAAYWRVRKSSGGQAVGFGIVNPGTSSGLVAAAGLPGNTTGNAIAAGYVGERIELSVTSAVVTNTSSPTSIGAITLTTGVWLISASSRSLGNATQTGTVHYLYQKGANAGTDGGGDLDTVYAFSAAYPTNCTFATRALVVASGDADKTVAIKQTSITAAGSGRCYICAVRIA